MSIDRNYIFDLLIRGFGLGRFTLQLPDPADSNRRLIDESLMALKKGNLFYAEKTANARCRDVPALRLPVDFDRCGSAALQSGWLLGRRHRSSGRGAGNRGRIQNRA